MTKLTLAYQGEILVETVSWHELSAEINQLHDEEKTNYESLFDCEEGEVLALEHRRDCEMEWPGDRVFVVKKGDSVYIYDESGVPIHDPECSLINGKQFLDSDDASSFAGDWEQGYYQYEELIRRNSASEEDEEVGTGSTGDGGNFESIVKEGARIKKAMDRPVKWYGALVGGGEGRHHHGGL